MAETDKPAPVAARGNIVLKTGDVVDGWVVGDRGEGRAEALEAHLVHKKDLQGILRLYRNKLTPSKDFLNKLLALKHGDLVNVIAYGTHSSGLFYEVVESSAGAPVNVHGPLDEGDVTGIIRAVNQALMAIHAAGLIHRGLSSSSIHRGGQEDGYVIGDLVLNNLVDAETEHTQAERAGSLAPEVHLGVVGPKLDYYALGICIWELLAGTSAFSGRDLTEVQREAVEGKTVENLLSRTEARSISERMKTLLKGLLQHRQDKRWGASEVDLWLGESPAAATGSKGTGQKALDIGPDSWTQEFFDALIGGTKVSLRPGQYQGTIVLKSAIHLVSADPSDRAILVPGESSGNRKGHAIVLAGQKPGSLRHLVFQGENNADHILLRIEDGTWTVEDCVFHRAYDHAIVVSGRGTNPVVRRCRIYGGFSGILVEKLATGTFEDNEVFDHVKNNVVVQDPETAPVFRGNRVHDSRQGGFFVSTGAAGTYEGNDIYGNILANVIVRDQGTNPRFVGNKVHEGNRGGFYLLEGASGVYEENDVWGNTTTNIEVKDYGTTPHFFKNKIHDGKQGGISVYGTAAGRFEENDIYANTLANVFVFQSGTNPEFVNNQVHDGKHTGFSIYGAANGIFDDNKIYRNAQANVFIYQTGTSPAFSNNKIHDGKHGGFFIHGGAAGEYDGNEIFDNIMANIEVLDSGTNPLFRNNKVRSCLNEGLLIQNGASGRFEGNEFHGNGFSTKGLKDAGPGYPSIRIKDQGTSPTFRDNRVIGFACAAIEVSKGAAGVYEDNQLLDLDRGNNFVFDKKWDVKLGCSPRRKNNTER